MKQKSDKKDPKPSHQSSRNREEYYSRRERNYMPRRPDPASDMGPPRSRHVYDAEEGPRTWYLLDKGNDPLFNKNRKNFFFVIRDELPASRPTTTPLDRRNFNLWCDYHKENDHTLAQCHELKRILYQLAKEGKLEMFMNRKEYGTRNDAERRAWIPQREEIRRESSNTQGTIHWICGGYYEDFPTIHAAKDSVHTLLKGPQKTT